MDRKLELFRSELKAKGLNSVTIDKYLWVIRKFLEFSNNETGKEQAVNFLNSLIDEQKKPAFRRFCHYALRNWFRFSGLKWDLAPPEVNRYEQTRPIMSLHEIEKLIKKAKQVCNNEELAKLAVSTVYGLRRAEIRLITKEDINPVKNTINIKTRKKGRYRTHLIPEEIRDYVYWYEWDKIVSDNQTSVIFRGIFKKCGMYQDGFGPHTIRRSLATQLGMKMGGMDREKLKHFLRWKDRYEDILALYQQFDKESESIDKEVFQVHPFLPFWRD